MEDGYEVVDKKLEFSPEQVEILRKFWRKTVETSDKYWDKVYEIEQEASKATGIDIEMFFVGGDLVGIGDYPREYGLLQDIMADEEGL